MSIGFNMCSIGLLAKPHILLNADYTLPRVLNEWTRVQGYGIAHQMVSLVSAE